ncbi:MAG: hypothetical protein COB58_00310 [Thalassobium sp.]|nr:MAG: hypothetical protein COB58_12325 [Thalassobium sp.]PHQ88299.1 MAG: hypothetical protein COB58_00310 [Thalassobium sp.]
MSWPLVPLLNCCSVSTGKHDANHGEVNGCYPFYTCADKPIRANTFSFDGDSIILPGNGANVGLVLFYSGKFEAYQRTYVLNKFVESVDSRYVYHHLNRYWKLRNERTQFGSATNYIRMQNFEDYEIPLPPLAEQQRIAAILDKADAIRRKRQQAIQLADDFLRAVFLDMFGDPVTNPKGFKTRFLGDFYIDGKNGTKCGPFGSALKKDEYTESGIPIWGMDNINLNGEFIDAPSQWVSEEKYRELESYSLCQGDVIISRAGTVGKMGVVRSISQRSLISTNLIRVRFGALLLPEYFVSLMTYCKGRVGRLKVGPDGAFTHMNVGVLDTLEFPYPPIQLQEKYLDVRRKVMGVLDKEEYSRKSLAYLFDSISQKAFSGKL